MRTAKINAAMDLAIVMTIAAIVSFIPVVNFDKAYLIVVILGGFFAVLHRQFIIIEGQEELRELLKKT